MAKELTIATKLPDISLPGVISGCRVMFSSENHLSISQGRFVTPTGGFAEIRRTVRDAVLLPDKQDIVYITGSVSNGGMMFNARTEKGIGREETVLAMVKVLKYPVRSREDIKISHSVKSSNAAMSKVITLTSCADGETTEWVIPWRIPVDHHTEIFVGGVLQEEFEDYTLYPVKDSYDRRYTKIIFEEAPHINANITVQSGLMEGE